MQVVQSNIKILFVIGSHPLDNDMTFQPPHIQVQGFLLFSLSFNFSCNIIDSGPRIILLNS